MEVILEAAYHPRGYFSADGSNPTKKGSDNTGKKSGRSAKCRGHPGAGPLQLLVHISPFVTWLHSLIRICKRNLLNLLLSVAARPVI